MLRSAETVDQRRMLADARLERERAAVGPQRRAQITIAQQKGRATLRCLDADFFVTTDAGTHTSTAAGDLARAPTRAYGRSHRDRVLVEHTRGLGEVRRWQAGLARTAGDATNEKQKLAHNGRTTTQPPCRTGFRADTAFSVETSTVTRELQPQRRVLPLIIRRAGVDEPVDY